MKWTPGPWIVERFSKATWVTVGHPTGQAIAKINPVNNQDKEEAGANALLISLAPSMAEALQEIERTCHKDMTDENRVESISRKARSLLAELGIDK